MDIEVQNEEETKQFAELLGTLAEPGDVIILSGELGAGKTTMTKGIAKGLFIDQMIKSPTYTIIREYSSGRLPLYHMDVYRTGDDIEALGLDEYFEGEGLTVVEWGKLLEENLPDSYLEITLQKDSNSENKRIIQMTSVGAAGKAYFNKIKAAWEGD